MLSQLKTKALVYVGLVHMGLILLLVGFFREDGPANASGATTGLMLAGISLLYGAFLFSVLSIWLPIRPWLSRYQRARAWRTWIIDELPTIMALIPVLVGALKIFQAAWAEIKCHQANGELNVAKLAEVAQKFAINAETLAHDPTIERVRKKIQNAD